MSHHVLDVPMSFLLKMGSNSNKGELLILCNKLCLHLEELHNPVNQYLPNDQCIVFQNHTWVKEPSQVKERQMLFYVTDINSFLIFIFN